MTPTCSYHFEVVPILTYTHVSPSLAFLHTSVSPCPPIYSPPPCTHVPMYLRYGLFFSWWIKYVGPGNRRDNFGKALKGRGAKVQQGKTV